jgi:RNA polymerase sigma-70 factor (ECF subfamily)
VELWQQVQAGDDEAFRRLAEELWPRLYRLAYRFLGDAGEAEDVAQEALLRAWARLSAFRGESQFSTWVLAIGLNMARNRRRRKIPLLLPAPEPASMPDSRHPSAEDTLLQAERLERLERALGALPPLWRAALECVAVQDMSYEDTARVFGVRASTIRNWIHRARVKLREDWSDDTEAVMTRVRREGGVAGVRTNP